MIALSLYLHGMTFVFLGMFIAASAGEVLFNKEEGDILLHRPITSKALLWAQDQRPGGSILVDSRSFQSSGPDYGGNEFVWRLGIPASTCCIHCIGSIFLHWIYRAGL